MRIEEASRNRDSCECAKEPDHGPVTEIHDGLSQSGLPPIASYPPPRWTISQMQEDERVL